MFRGDYGGQTVRPKKGPVLVNNAAGTNFIARNRYGPGLRAAIDSSSIRPCTLAAYLHSRPPGQSGGFEGHAQGTHPFDPVQASARKGRAFMVSARRPAKAAVLSMMRSLAYRIGSQKAYTHLMGLPPPDLSDRWRVPGPRLYLTRPNTKRRSRRMPYAALDSNA